MGRPGVGIRRRAPAAAPSYASRYFFAVEGDDSVRRTALLRALVVVLATASLAGCSTSNFSSTPDDTPGTWRAGSDLPTQLELAADGTFEATSWPLNVSCTAIPPLTIDAVRESETLDLSGTWEEGEEGVQNERPNPRIAPESAQPGTSRDPPYSRGR